MCDLLKSQKHFSLQPSQAALLTDRRAQPPRYWLSPLEPHQGSIASEPVVKGFSRCAKILSSREPLEI
jgi:hypothetical protein